MRMLVVQRKVSVRLEVPFFRLKKVKPVLSLVHGKRWQWQWWSGRWSTCARWIRTQCTCDQVQIVWEEQVAVHQTTWTNMQRVHESQGKVWQIIGADWEEKGHKGGGYKGEGPRWVTIVGASSAAIWIVVHSTGAVIQILPLQPVTLTSKTVLLAPDPTVPATPLFLGDSSSLPEIKTLWVDESESDSVPCKRLKTGNMDKGRTAKIAEARLVITMCELWVHSTQAFLKDLEVQSSQMVWFIGEQIGELEQLKGILDEMDEMWGTQSHRIDSSPWTWCK